MSEWRIENPTREDIRAAALAAIWLHRMGLVNAHWLGNILTRCQKMEAAEAGPDPTLLSAVPRQPPD